ncbi:HAMP domain-containing histidine kinase [Ktedonobacteria bacterium brp13]|nr:HAMP domain-containing histidine kinase [Ktedonobacteria bacterium brp13]
MTLWYVVTIAVVLLLLEGLLCSTLIKITPSLEHTTPLMMILQFFLVGFAILIFIIAGGYWLAVSAMRPIHLITQTAQEIGRMDLSRRFHLNRHDELGALADTFDEMLNRLESGVSRQRQFTADASHELRTPLSILSISASRALSQWDEPENYGQALERIEEYRRTLSIVQAEAEHMTHLVNDLLLLARGDMGQGLSGPKEVDVSEVTLEVVERLAPLAHKGKIELVFGELPELCVSGERMLLTIMMTNLISNAVKYTAGVGNYVLVEGGIIRKGEKSWCRIEIKDNGSGITEEHQHLLFERFYRGDMAHASFQMREENSYEDITSGSGLGLAIVQWVVRVHQGEICLHSTVGKGSIFEVWLPLVEGSHSSDK